MSEAERFEVREGQVAGAPVWEVWAVGPEGEERCGRFPQQRQAEAMAAGLREAQKHQREEGE